MIKYTQSLKFTNVQSNIMKALVRSRRASSLTNENINECEIITATTSHRVIASFTMNGDLYENADVVEYTMNNFLLNRKDVEIHYLTNNNARLYDFLDDDKTFILKIKMDIDSLSMFKTPRQKLFFNNLVHKTIDRQLFYDTKNIILDVCNNEIQEIRLKKKNKEYKESINEINELIDKYKNFLKKITPIKYSL